MPPIIYKSKYSIICDLIGHPKPKTQEEENYCQLVELQNETWIKVQTEMLNDYVNKINSSKELQRLWRYKKYFKFKLSSY